MIRTELNLRRERSLRETSILYVCSINMRSCYVVLSIICISKRCVASSHHALTSFLVRCTIGPKRRRSCSSTLNPQTLVPLPLNTSPDKTSSTKALKKAFWSALHPPTTSTLLCLLPSLFRNSYSKSLYLIHTLRHQKNICQSGYNATLRPVFGSRAQDVQPDDHTRRLTLDCVHSESRAVAAEETCTEVACE